MPSGFPAILADLISKRNLSVREVALKAGIEPAYLHRVVKAAKPLPAHRIESLADSIGLEGAERERFIEDAYLERADPFMQALVLKLKSEIARLKVSAPRRAKH